MRQFQKALRFIDRALDIAPADNVALALKAGIYQALGQLDEADAVLARMRMDASDETAVDSMATQFMLRHDYPAGVALMQSSLAKMDHATIRTRRIFVIAWQFFSVSTGTRPARNPATPNAAMKWKIMARQPDPIPSSSSWIAFHKAGLGEKEPRSTRGNRRESSMRIVL